MGWMRIGKENVCRDIGEKIELTSTEKEDLAEYCESVIEEFQERLKKDPRSCNHGRGVKKLESIAFQVKIKGKVHQVFVGVTNDFWNS